MPYQGAFRGKRLADGMESLIGAYYLAGAAAEAEANMPSAAAAGDGGGGSAAAMSAAMLADFNDRPVSAAGLTAAAGLCEAMGVLPPGEREGGV